MDKNVLNLISSFLETEIMESSSSVPSIETSRQSPLIMATNGILCFSKDRPFQLQAFIESAKLRWMPPPSLIVALYTSNEELQPLYDIVFGKHKDVIVVKENIFHADFLHCLDLLAERVDIISLCVDDMLFFSEVTMG